MSTTEPSPKAMLLIYTEQYSERLAYVLQVLLGNISGISFNITTNQDAFRNANVYRINYSRYRIHEDEFFLPPTGLLGESGTNAHEISVIQHRAFSIFFPSGEGHYPFDIFAASFYLLSRYEEYLPHEKDKFGRYDHRQSLAFREGFLDRPLVNEWMADFRKNLGTFFPNLYLPEPVFRFQPSYDIDIAFAYRERSLLRCLGGLGRDIIQGKGKAVLQRIRVAADLEADPYDVYEWLDALHLRLRLKPVYFFLVAGKQVGVDKNIAPRRKTFRELLQYHSMGYQVGIHPSWQSGDHADLLGTEISELENITGQDIFRSRQHYIRMNLPGTYRSLLNHGIREDYSMGYGAINGFRASVASPFPWYDLEREQTTDLILHPFCFMDANEKFAQGHTPAQAFETLNLLHQRVKKTGGTLSTIFHNNYLGAHPDYAGWKEVYETFLEEVVYWDV